MTQIQTVTQLLPIVPKQVDEGAQVTDYIYEPNATEVLNEILPKHIEVQIFRSLLESAASEHGARMTAMDSASKNACRNDWQADPAVQPCTSGCYHQGTVGDHLRR